MSKRAFVFVVWTAYSCLMWSHAAIAEPSDAGQVDASFVPQTPFGQTITAVAIRPDNRVVAATGNSFLSSLQQFHPNGSLDTNFVSVTFSNSIAAIALDTAGNIIVGADQSPRTNLARRLSRLNPDGSFDRTFETSLPMLEIDSIVLHPSGRIVYGGLTEGEGNSPIAALTSQGERDPTFVLRPIIGGGGGVSGSNYDRVQDINLTDDGKMILAGLSNARSHPDRSPDTSFRPLTRSVYPGSDSRRRPWTPAAALVGGGAVFTTVQETIALTRRALVRTLPNGEIDAGFELEPNLSNRVDQITALDVQTDGKIVFASILRAYNNEPYKSQLVRIDRSGRLDTNFFSSEFWGIICDMKQDATGGLLLAGSFTNIAGVARTNLARIHLDPPALPIVSQQPASVIATHGQDARLWVETTTTPDTRFQWHSSATAIAAATNAVLTLRDLRTSDAGNYFVTISNSFGMVTSEVATVTVNAHVVQPGALDLTFNSGVGGNNAARAIGKGRDGKLLIAGNFSEVQGTPRSYLARFHRDGRLDTSFNPPAIGFVRLNCVAEGPAGEVYVGGSFTNFAGHATHGVACLNSDGSLNTEFTAAPLQGTNNVRQLFVTRTGKLYVVGDFTGVGTNTLQRAMVKLLPSGELDEGFSPFANLPVFVPVVVQAAALCADERLLVVYRSGSSVNLSRLLPSGASDPSFASSGGIDVSALIEQPDGKILVYAWTLTPPRIQRFLPNGQRDGTFATNNDAVRYFRPGTRLGASSCGRAFVGGNYTPSSSVLSQYLFRRLDASGDFDAAWVEPTIDGFVRDMTLLDDGTLAIVGDFASVNGATRGRIALLHDGPYSPPAIINQPVDPYLLTEGDALHIPLALDCAVPKPSITWLLNGTNVITSMNPDLVFPSATRLNAGDYQAVVSNAFGVVTSAVVRVGVTPVQSAVATPSLSVSSPLLSNAVVNTILVQPDQHLVLLGSFSNALSGANVNTLRVDRRGLLDPTFELNSRSSLADAAGGALQADGRIVISERVRRPPGLSESTGFLRRLRGDGSHDPAFPLFQYDNSPYPGGQFLSILLAISWVAQAILVLVVSRQRAP